MTPKTADEFASEVIELLDLGNFVKKTMRSKLVAAIHNRDFQIATSASNVVGGTQ